MRNKKINQNTNINNYFRNHVDGIFFFSLFFIIFLGFSVIQKQNELHFDCTYYWTVSDAVYENGFNILNFPETFRGCIFPLMIGVLKTVIGTSMVNQLRGWSIIISIMISFLYAWCFPCIFDLRLQINKKNIIGSICLIVLTIIYWGNFLQLPLSDFPAIFFLLCGTACILTIKKRNDLALFKQLFLAFIGGIIFYAAYNTRVAYLYGIIIIVAIFFISQVGKNFKSNIKISILLISLLCGCFLCALPQMLINHKYLGKYSPKVYTEQIMGYQSSLQTQQIFLGLESDRYETYVGAMDTYEAGAVFFDDKAGKEILLRENQNEYNFRIRRLCKFAIKYPLDLAGIYVRHLIQILTPVYLNIYIPKLFIRKGWYILLNIILWGILGVRLLCIKINKNNLQKILILLAMLLPSMMQILGQVELRFFLMGYLLLYFIICFKTDYKSLYSAISKNAVGFLAVFITITLMWIAIVGSGLANGRQKPILIDDYSNYNYEIKEE